MPLSFPPGDGGGGSGDALVANNLDQFADVSQTAGKTLSITDSTTLNGGTHSGTNTGDQTLPTRDSLGLDTDDSPQFAGVNLGHASDTTLGRAAAGVMSVEGNPVPSPASPVQGDVLYHNGTAWARLAAGTSGHFLKTNGAGSNPAWAAASGGDVVEIDLAAWVEADGNDTTGTVGDPARPYLTMQAAYDDGARVFFVGNGTFAGLSVSGEVNIAVRGFGLSMTTITVAESTNSQAVVIHDLGYQSCNFVTIGRNGATGALEADGATGSNITLHNVRVGTVQNAGGVGGATDGNANGGSGGTGGALTATNCDIDYIYCNGGKGGDGDGAALNLRDAGPGGAGGNVNLSYCSVSSCTTAGGSGGDSSNTTSASGGDGGNLTLRHCVVSTSATLSPGGTGTGGSGGTAGACGDLTTYLSSIEADLYMADGSGAGTVAGFGLFVGILNGTPTISAKRSTVQGTDY